MNSYRSSVNNRNVYMFLLATLALPTLSNAEIYDFKVVYAEVPGTEEIRAGNHDAAIEILESRAEDASNYYFANELATLCALYVVNGKLAAAHETCHVAVETDQSDAAYNNRGVLRAHLGDVAGAMEDFERARVLPDNQQRYVEELMKGDARLIASSNYAVATEYIERRGHLMQAMASPVPGQALRTLTTDSCSSRQ